MSDPLSAAMAQRLEAHVRGRAKDCGAVVGSRPVTDYTDRSRFELEMRALFHELPIVIAHSSQLPAAGDFITDNRLGVPLLLTRTEAGTVAAHLNVCPHRGAIVETAACGRRSHFECPYHSWSFGLDGSLRGITDAESFAGMDKR